MPQVHTTLFAYHSATYESNNSIFCSTLEHIIVKIRKLILSSKGRFCDFKNIWYSLIPFSSEKWHMPLIIHLCLMMAFLFPYALFWRLVGF